MSGSAEPSASAADPASPAAPELRYAFAGFATGITLVAALVDGQPVGMLANSFSSISLNPPLAALSFARTSTTWPVLRRAPQWGISVLGAHHRADVARLSRPGAERFDGVSWEATGHGAVFLDRAPTTFRVGVATEVDAGDHVLTLLRVHALSRSADGVPLIFYDSRLHSRSLEQP
ncbi:flavin reductase family protein [Actinoplanes sp. NPDC023936]|uniref:flavin reductase family protein n=1 Tax=Actinoplanes sp. NPDC023936 TaxID=3154910 RepID=UPI0033C0E126